MSSVSLVTVMRIGYRARDWDMGKSVAIFKFYTYTIGSDESVLNSEVSSIQIHKSI